MESCHGDGGGGGPQRREQWVPMAEERKNSQSGEGRGGAVQEGAEMVRGVCPWGRPGSWDSSQATCAGDYIGGGDLQPSVSWALRQDYHLSRRGAWCLSTLNSETTDASGGAGVSKPGRGTAERRMRLLLLRIASAPAQRSREKVGVSAGHCRVGVLECVRRGGMWSIKEGSCL